MTGLRYKSNGNGTGSWVGRYYIGGKEQPMGLGSFPEVGMSEARNLHKDNRAKVRIGQSPVQEKRQAVEQAVKVTNSVEDVVRDCHSFFAANEWKNGGARNGFMPKMEAYVFPKFGDRSISEMDGEMIAEICEPFWHDRKSIADKILSHLSKVIGRAAAKKIPVDRMAVKDARKLLSKSNYKSKHHKTIGWRAVPKYYASLGGSMAERAEKFYILSACRVSNVVAMPWSEIHGDVWHIPEDRMKREAPQFVPLSRQMREILDQVPELYTSPDYRNGYVFSNPRAWETGHVSGNNFSQKMRRAGLDATAHGMRTCFKTWAETHKVADRVDIEEAMHHRMRPEQESAYIDMTELVEVRRPLLQAWADFVTGET